MDDAELRQAQIEQRRFESNVRKHLDHALNPRGFRLSPQGFGFDPGGGLIHSAVYEADPEYYARRYPALRSKFDGELSCIDLWIKKDPASGRLNASLEGNDVLVLLAEIGATRETNTFLQSGDLDGQLVTLGVGIQRVLDHFAV